MILYKSHQICKRNSNDRTISVLLVLFVMLQLVDAATTLYGIEHGLKEHNDMLVSAAQYIGLKSAVMSAKVLCVLAAIYFCRTFRGALAKVVLTGATTFYFCIAAGNVLTIIKS